MQLHLQLASSFVTLFFFEPPAQAADPVGVRGKGDRVDERVYFGV